MILPVKQNDQYGGWAELSGLLRVEPDSLVLEYTLTDDVLGVFNSDVKTLKIPFVAIEDVQIKKKWFSARFEVYLNRLPKTEKSLSLKKNCLSFTIKKSELNQAKSLKSKLMLNVSEEKLRRIESEEENREPEFQFYTKKADPEDLKNILRENEE